MPDLPTGTVTFLFTDIEGSTRLLHELGERYVETLAEHRRAIRAACARHGGVEVDTQGDSFLVAFANAGEAAAAAAEAQTALAASAVRVRMGVHTGEPIVWAEGYAGVDLHRGARIAAAAHGGQVVLSERTASLLDGVELRPLGAHRLKDLSRPQPLFQLGKAEFPPLRSLNQSNLPVQPTPFLGRERELAEVLGLLGRNGHALTLTGPGGSGKTRLALQAAAEVVENFPHGVWWVPLQAVRDAALVETAIAQTVGASGDLAEHLAGKRLLLVLDNLEQLLAAAPRLAELLAGSAELQLVVTSREPLRIEAEREYAVPPLVEQEAVGFFLSRARAIRPDFQAEGSVLEICRRLDNLPLALELAAARVKAMSPMQILERLERRLPLLTQGRRDAPERQRTLRATIEWSHDLLAPEEQQLFARLGVFAGGCTLDAAETVCGGDLDVLHSLVDKSLLRLEEDRYAMLETIREYALEHLEESGEAETVRRRHAEWALALAESANLSQETLANEQQFDLVVAEQDNIRAALDWALAADVELGLRLAVALELFWVLDNTFEGARRLEELLERGGSASIPLRARAWRALGSSLNPLGEHERAERAYTRSLELFREAGDDEGAAIALFRIGATAANLRDPARARPLLEESLAQLRKVGNRGVEGQVIGLLGVVAFLEHDFRGARPLLARSAAIAREDGFDWWQGVMLANLVELAFELGDLAEVEARAREAVSLFRRIGDRRGMVYGLAYFARLAAQRGEHGRAGRLWGAIEGEESRGRVGGWESEREQYEVAVLAHTNPKFERARAEGAELSLERAVSEALGED